MADELDPIDARILDILQQDAGLSVAEVAERVGLSASPCWRRIKRLEDSGLIRKRVTLLDAALLGLDFEVYAIVKLSLPSRDNLDAFEAAVTHWPEVVQCASDSVAKPSTTVLSEPARPVSAADSTKASSLKRVVS